MAKTPDRDEDEEDEGPSHRFSTRLPVQTMDYLKDIKKTGTYGRTVSSVVKAFIDAGIRDAIDRKYISVIKADD